MKRLKTIFAAAAVLVTVAACGDDDEGIVYGGGGTNVLATLKEKSVESRLEVPARKSSNIFISHWTVEGKDSVMSFCYEYDRQKYHTRWVAYRFDGITSKSITGRSNEWGDDPKLAKAGISLGTGYFSGGYERGHICPSADRTYSKAANVQTFYTSNMSPQDHEFNSGLWAQHEQFVRDLGRRCYEKNSKNSKRFADTLYVVKGGTIDSGKTLGMTKFSSSSYNVTIPNYYFVALLKVKDGRYDAIGFKFCRESDNDKSFNAFDYAMSIDELEAFTGIDFFANLPDATEKNIEQAYVESAWK